MRRWQRFWRIAPAYLRTVARREWQLGLLAVLGLAPGVAALTAWINLGLLVQDEAPQSIVMLTGWLLPPFLLELLGASGILLGTGLVSLLIGCLSLTNIYLLSLERRLSEIGLLMAFGLNRIETQLLLMMEALAAGLLGSGVGIVLGLILSLLSWPSAREYFQLHTPFHIMGSSAILGGLLGTLAALLFMGTAIAMSINFSGTVLNANRPLEEDPWQIIRTSLWGPLFAGGITLLATLSVASFNVALLLGGLTLLLAGLLTSGGWLLTHAYRQLPTPAALPLWSMAVQGLARHPNHTTGMALSFITGAYGVGISALTWLADPDSAPFPFWAAGMILVAGASLVLTIASVAAWERRQEFGLLASLGARRNKLRRLILIEYAIVALSAGLLGSLMALVNWVSAGSQGGWFAAVAIVIADTLATLFSAWVGAYPVVQILLRRPLLAALRGS